MLNQPEIKITMKTIEYEFKKIEKNRPVIPT